MEKGQENYGEKRVSHREGESADSCEKTYAERKLEPGEKGLKEQKSSQGCRCEIQLSSRTKLCQQENERMDLYWKMSVRSQDLLHTENIFLPTYANYLLLWVKVFCWQQIFLQQYSNVLNNCFLIATSFGHFCLTMQPPCEAYVRQICLLDTLPIYFNDYGRTGTILNPQAEKQ